jgi:hypothetical protein
MTEIDRMSDDELLREMFRAGHSASLAAKACESALNLRLHPQIVEMKHKLSAEAHSLKEEVLKRMQSRAPSHEWNGIGPKRDCLLRVVWDDSKGAEWVHFEWKDNDVSGYNDGEGEHSVTHEGYYNDASCISITESSDGWMGHSGKFDDINGADFTITHWADLPSIEEPGESNS